VAKEGVRCVEIAVSTDISGSLRAVSAISAHHPGDNFPRNLECGVALKLKENGGSAVCGCGCPYS
jgi:hypothetical protein